MGKQSLEKHSYMETKGLQLGGEIKNYVSSLVYIAGPLSLKTTQASHQAERILKILYTINIYFWTQQSTKLATKTIQK